jgi:hypothetical protein
MAQKNWVIGLASFLLVVLLFAGFMAYAAEVLGSRNDPLVTASYITEELLPNLNQKIDAAMAAKSGEFTAKLQDKYEELAAQLERGDGAAFAVNDPALINAVADAVLAQQGGGAADTMKLVEVPSGKTVTLELGSEALLRIGSATCVASGTPGLIDMTAGSDLSGGSALVTNHLYLCTVENRGFKATSAVKIFIRGGYKID